MHKLAPHRKSQPVADYGYSLPIIEQKQVLEPFLVDFLLIGQLRLCKLFQNSKSDVTVPGELPELSCGHTPDPCDHHPEKRYGYPESSLVAFPKTQFEVHNNTMQALAEHATRTSPNTQRGLGKHAAKSSSNTL